MGGYIGKIENFDDGIEQWTSYTERLEQYFAVNEISNEKRVPALLSLIGGKTYALLRNLTTPDKPKDKSYDDIVKVLKEHLSPAPLVIAERFRFHKRDQKSGESINEDRLVCGLKSEQTQKKLLSVQALTLEKAMQISVAMETATKDALELQGKQPESAVHKVKSQKPKVNSYQQKPITCYRCNKQGHKADTCRFKDQTCHKCKKKGHIQAACRSKMIKRNVHSLNADDSQDDEFGIYTVFANKDTQKGNNDVGIYTVNSKTKEITVDVKIDNKSVEMEVDTGSALSIIPKKAFDQMFPNRKLDSTDVILRTFSGEKFKPLGVTAVNVNYNDQSEVLSLYVVQKGGGILIWKRLVTKNQTRLEQNQQSKC
ncbi:Hypothetical predicted protein [Mytilus galloprovincialis]|uniref:CCHC-type domain-containing protein n=1 Tax=Mytilus galloprovincialis TaxID=29158 RepID=A0A8B6EWV0_MYTGA|nr:Hypothetical predicted protein [Mytilus galloprovincialis]